MLSKTLDIVNKTKEFLRSHAHIDARLDEIQFSQGVILANLAERRRSGTLRDFEFKVFSQWGEDGIIQKLIRHLEIPNKCFVEFGVQDFRESNCRFLLMYNNWRGFVIDAEPKDIAAIRKSPLAWRHHLEAICEFINCDNINGLLARSNFGEDLGILSIDMDGVDYWILNAIEVCRPRILIVEFNGVFGAERPITVPYDPYFVRTNKHYSNLYYGASLAAFHYIANRRGYSLIGTNSAGSNAFFVRDDQLVNCPFPPLTAQEAFVDSTIRESKDESGNLSFRSGGDRLTPIRGLPVINVVTGAAETL